MAQPRALSESLLRSNWHERFVELWSVIFGKDSPKGTSAVSRLASCAAALVMFFLACGPDVPPQYQGFVSLPHSERAEALRSYPLPQRLEAYMWAQAAITPPPQGLTFVMAEAGIEVVPLVQSRLETATTTWEVESLLAVLGEISCQNGVDLRDDDELRHTVAEAVGRVEGNALIVQDVQLIESGCIGGGDRGF